MASATALLLMASGCDTKSSGQAQRVSHPASLPELLQAHDVEVAEHGKDLTYIKPIGSYGREGVVASLDHIEKRGKTVSSYNSIELVFGVAEDARMKTGYDICKDNVILARLAVMGKVVDAPAYERTVYNDLLSGYCKADGAAKETGQPKGSKAAKEGE